MKKLIVATDFSKTSLNAVNYAADMAAAIHAKLEVLHVIQVLAVSDIPYEYIRMEEETHEQQSRKMELLKQKLEKRTEYSIPVMYKVLEGDASNTIKSVAEDEKPLAIVLGSKGVTNFQNIIFGSVALHTAKHVQCPVLLIPEKAKFTSVATIAFATELLPEYFTPAIKHLRRWLNLFNARLDVVHVKDTQLFKSEKQEQFASFKKHLSRYDVNFNYALNDSVHGGISSYIKKNKPDMLVLVYHKESFLHRLTNSSEFNHIFRNIAIPLLVIPG